MFVACGLMLMSVAAVGTAPQTKPAQSKTAPATAGQGKTTPMTTLSGIYTVAQAAKGEETYYTLCISCHPKGTYAGAGFKSNWGGKPLSDLYDWVLNKMPKNDPGSLTPAESVEVIAYILQQNKMPAGKTPLAPNPNALFRILIQLK